MVAKFPKLRRDVRKVVYYSETKVKKGGAEYIFAGNFHKDIEEMTAEEKVAFFLLHNRKRPNVLANTPHIILSFHPSEKFSKDEFSRIAQEFMSQIGFGEQPYLVYHHLDTKVPHLHIITTLIKADGGYIDPHNIGKEKCMPACQKIEEKFQLVKAKGREKQQPGVQAGKFRRLEYGQTETFKSLSETIQEVVDGYIFTSMGEYNAILREYNLLSKSGRPGTNSDKNKALYYFILDKDGKPTGVPIKSSSLPGKPTLRNLQEIFIKNRPLQAKNLQSVRTRVAWAIKKKPRNLDEFKQVLSDEQVKTILWQNETGWLYGVTFFDLRTKTSINGRSLGKDMGISAIQSTLSGTGLQGSQNMSTRPEVNAPGQQNPAIGSQRFQPAQEDSGMAQLIEILLQPVQADERVPYEFSAKKKKKPFRRPNS